MKYSLSYKKDGVFVYQILDGKVRIDRRIKNITRVKKKKATNIVVRELI